MRNVALTLFILAVALTRLLPHPPNFAPITAMAVFGAITFGRWRTAVVAPLVALFVSDLAKEYLWRQGMSAQWGIYRGMWVTYGTTALVALMSRLAHGTRRLSVMAGTTLLGSIVFFVVTNFAIWARGTRFPHTLDGLTECYLFALPFFRNSLAGDVVYAVVLFGVWALAERYVPGLRPRAAEATPLAT
ncbi:MAG TPA: DUF6580 family putative transport protein [Gemmataceae bacterium]|jgi:hypothetical protein|nr:DUF6580 family putative transport protein [Gemmataceae bacterium]